MAERPYFISPEQYGGAFREVPTVIQASGPRVNNGDWLTLTLTTSDSSGSVEINGRILTDDGTIVPFTGLMTFSGTGTQTAIIARLGGGWLQGFSVHRVSGTLTDGEVVAAVHLGTGEGSVARQEVCLASGEITNIRSLGMGAFLIRGPETSAVAPTVTTLALANPSPGADFTTTVTAGQTWEIYAIRGILTTAVAVANRFVRIQLDDGTNVISRSAIATAQTASLAFGYNAFRGGLSFTPSDSSNYQVSLPTVFLQAGGKISSNTQNIQAADQWSAVVIHYRQY